MMSKDLDRWTDRQLMEAYRQTGDRFPLGTLLERYTLLLYGVALKYLKEEDEARDAVQQVFLKALTELDKYQVEYPKSWLYAIMRNHCLMRLRDNSAQRVPLDESMSPPTEDSSDEPDALRSKELQLSQLEEAMGKLSPEQKCCIQLFYLERKSYQQVCACTGFEYGEVKSHIQNGRRNLKLYLERKSSEI